MYVIVCDGMYRAKRKTPENGILTYSIENARKYPTRSAAEKEIRNPFEQIVTAPDLQTFC